MESGAACCIQTQADSAEIQVLKRKTWFSTKFGVVPSDFWCRKFQGMVYFPAAVLTLMCRGKTRLARFPVQPPGKTVFLLIWNLCCLTLYWIQKSGAQCVTLNMLGLLLGQWELACECVGVRSHTMRLVQYYWNGRPAVTSRFAVTAPLHFTTMSCTESWLKSALWCWEMP